MAIAELIMPKMGESIMEATILRWHKKVGDRVVKDETVLDIATDKVDSEIPSTFSGVITELLYQVNDVVPVGAVIARLEVGSDHHATTPVYNPAPAQPVYQPQQPVTHTAPVTPAYTYSAPPAPVHHEPVIPPHVEEQVPFAPHPSSIARPATGNNRFFSPLVLNIANSEGLNLSELERIPGTGADGRVSKRDVLQYIADKKAGLIPAFNPPAPPAAAPVNQTPAPERIYTSTAPVHVPEAPVFKVDIPHTAFQAPAPPAPVHTPEPVYQPVQPVYIPPVTPIIQQEQPAYHTPEPVYIPPPVVPAPAPVYQPAAPAVQPPPVAEPVYHQPVQAPVYPATEPAAIPAPAIHPVAEPVYHQPVQTPVYTTPEPVAAPAPKVQSVTSVQAAKTVTAAPVYESESQPVQHENKQPVEIIEMDRMRKLIAKHMVDSKHTSAHVTSFAEADVTNMVIWRDKIKNDFEKIQGTKITFTPMFIECLVKVMKRFPIINSSVEGDKILIKNYFNIGMATALPNKNLIVPVIKHAENQSLVSLTKAVNSLADDARNNRLKPEDIQGGTFTFTNVGTFGSLMGTPIINQPQVAILAVGAIKKRPVVVETPNGDFIGIRHMMYLSLSYDHRIIDGSIGASFLTEVAREFEKWDVNRELKLVVKEQYVD